MKIHQINKQEVIKNVEANQIRWRHRMVNHLIEAIAKVIFRDLSRSVQRRE